MSAPRDNKPWYADGLRFSCTQCGRCCGGAPGFVWVNEAEIAAIASRLAKPVEEFRAQHVRRVGRRESLIELPGGDCEFLVRGGDGRTSCSIHDIRPIQCRTWPFWDSNLKTPRAWESAARNCPGINHGDHHPLPVIRGALQENRLAQLPL